MSLAQAWKTKAKWGELYARHCRTCKDYNAMGIVLRKRHLLWGWRHGFMRSWPEWIKRTIVTVWNRVACLVLGHERFGPYPDAGIRKACMHCSKEWPA